MYETETTNTSVEEKKNYVVEEWEGFAEKLLLENDLEGASYFTNFSYDTAIVGYTDEHNVIYDYDKMIEWLVVTQNFSVEEAMEWIDFNTIRAIPYMPEPKPIIMFSVMPLD